MHRNTNNNSNHSPIPLAHFIGARRDIQAPILTKQSLHEMPEGWDQLAQDTAQNQSANFLSLRHQISDTNPSKRPLPAMTQSNHPDITSSNNNNNNKPSHLLPSKTNHPSKQISQHVASYLKPKTLADRLAQLGVSQDVKSIVPPAGLQQHKEHHSETIPSDLSRNVQRITKSITTNSFQPPTLFEEQPHQVQLKRPLSGVHILPTRGALPTIPSPRSNNNNNVLSSIHDPAPPTDPSSLQPTDDPSLKRNQPTQSTLPLLPLTQEPTSNLCIPNKSLTASLSRLAGSNIVQQRLQWSKEKEQLGTVPMDEFGNSLLKTSPNPPAQIPSPVLSAFSSTTTTAATSAAVTSKNSDLLNQNNRVFLERNKNSSLESSHSQPNPTSRYKLSPRLQVLNKLENHPLPVKPNDEPIKIKKNINQFNKSVRRSEEDEQQDELTPNLKGDDNLPHRDIKRNKKDENLQSSVDFLTSKKKEINKVDRSLFKTKQDTSPNSPSSSPRFPSSNKFRGTRSSHRLSSSTGSTTTSSSVMNNKRRNELIHKLTSPTSNSSSGRQLPSIPTFSPLIKKGTSELAAVWGTQLHSSNKKISSNNRPPLPMTPKVGPKASTAAPNDSRPLPVPPASSSLNLDPSTESRPRSRPLPVPHVKSPEPSALTSLENNSLNSHGDDIDTSLIWNKYQDQITNFLPELNRPNEQVEVEIFQLNRSGSEGSNQEFSTTSLGAEEYEFFYSRERLLIILKLNKNKMVLIIWKGSDIKEEDDDLKTRVKLENLLKKYQIDSRSKLIFVQSGYEPRELIKALGGRLILRKGDRYDSVYQRTLSSMFICKSFKDTNYHKSKASEERLIIIEEESILPSSPLVDLHLGSFFCSGYSSVLKFYNHNTESFSVFIWSGNFSDPIELEQCRILVRQIRNEVAPLKIQVDEVREGNEPPIFLDIFGKSNEFAQSYHWRFKSLVPMTTMITDGRGLIKSKISNQEVRIIWTGIEIYVIIPNDKQVSEMKNTLKLARSISKLINLKLLNVLPIHCIMFPSVIPRDLLASVRFSNELIRLNDGFGKVEKMNLVEINDVF